MTGRKNVCDAVKRVGAAAAADASSARRVCYQGAQNQASPLGLSTRAAQQNAGVNGGVHTLTRTQAVNALKPHNREVVDMSVSHIKFALGQTSTRPFSTSSKNLEKAKDVARSSAAKKRTSKNLPRKTVKGVAVKAEEYDAKVAAKTAAAAASSSSPAVVPTSFPVALPSPPEWAVYGAKLLDTESILSHERASVDAARRSGLMGTDAVAAQVKPQNGVLYVREAGPRVVVNELKQGYDGKMDMRFDGSTWMTKDFWGDKWSFQER